MSLSFINTKKKKKKKNTRSNKIKNYLSEHLHHGISNYK